MKKIVKCISMIKILFFGFTLGRTQVNVVYFYKEKTKEKEIIYSLREENKNSEKWIYAKSNEEEHIFVLKQDLSTIKWIFYNKKNNEKTTAERKGNTIILTKGDEVSEIKKFTVDDSPWYQFLEKSLSLLSITELIQKEFWIIRPTDFKVFKMIAYKEKNEKLSINGQEFNAIKISVSLSGVASLFWRVFYWFDEKTGLYLKYEGKRGISVPKTFVEFYKMEIIK